MKIYLAGMLLLNIGCTAPAKDPANEPTTATTSGTASSPVEHIAVPDVDSTLLTDKDSVLINIPSKEGYMVLSGKEFNYIVTHYPEIYADMPYPPDEAYAIWCERPKEGDASTCGPYFSFGSEVGRDGYYEMYAWFLRRKTGEHTYAARRKQLIELYLQINGLYGSFAYGGTYFGHQSERIAGYAEYDLYWLSKSKNEMLKSYNIGPQKSLYLSLLRQVVKDEVSVDGNSFTPPAKAAREKVLLKFVDNIDRLITDRFFLLCAQQFQYSHY